VARESGSSTGLQQGEAIVQPCQEFLRADGTDPRGRELDRQGMPSSR
jgi:hypothetical protein